jgi:DNA-binding MarR family transcriptional regulator
VTDSSPGTAQSLTDRTGYLLIKAGELALDMAERALVPLGVRARHANILALIAASPAVSQQQLSTQLSLDPTTVVALVDDLERGGLLRRSRDPKDRRRHILSITERGYQALEGIERALAGAEDGLLAPLEPHDVVALRGFVKRIVGTD